MGQAPQTGLLDPIIKQNFPSIGFLLRARYEVYEVYEAHLHQASARQSAE